MAEEFQHSVPFPHLLSQWRPFCGARIKGEAEALHCPDAEGWACATGGAREEAGREEASTEAQ